MIMGLATVSLVVVGVVSFELSQMWSLNAIDYISANYRQLACATVQYGVGSLLNQSIDGTLQAAMFVSGQRE